MKAVPPTRIVIFAKAPLPGFAKTRLIPALGAQGDQLLGGRLQALVVEHGPRSNDEHGGDHSAAGVRQEQRDERRVREQHALEPAPPQRERQREGGDEQRATLVSLSQLRGGSEVLEQARSIGGAAVERAIARLQGTFDELERRGAAERVQIDLGLLRDLGYYSGAILEIYDPAVGHVIGGGGRYDQLLSRFGRDLPAAGFSLYLERVHVAQAEEERAGEAQTGEGA